MEKRRINDGKFKKGNKKGVKFGSGQPTNNGGRPKKSWKKINIILTQKGIEIVNKETYYETIGRLMNATGTDMDNLLEDAETPLWLVWLITDLKESKNRDKIMSEYRDWMFGRATQKLDIKETTKHKFNNLGELREALGLDD